MSQCKGKQAYPNEERARRVLSIAWKHAISNGTTHELPCRAYRCTQCGKWHLTSKPDWKLTGLPKAKAPPKGRA